MAGRYIGEAIRTTYDILDYAKVNNKAGLLLLIDFEKAYDSISFQFITRVLNFFNFGKDLIKWVQILLHDFLAVINHCGNISKRFNIGRGCRQGDPIASYLFILCIEILAIKLRSSNDIEGIKLGNISHLMEIYADDLTIFMEPSDINLRNAIKTLGEFYQLSGLKISVSKTKAVWFGAAHGSNQKLCPDLDLKWVKSFTLLGIKFDNALSNMTANFDEKIQVVKKMLSNWSYRYLTPFGKVTVVKSLGLSKLSHLALVVPNPSKEMLKKIDTMFFKFIWGNGSEKVRRDDCKLPIKYGGIGAPDVFNFWMSFKFSWLRRFLDSESFWPKLLLQDINLITNLNLQPSDLLELGACKINEISKRINNIFWKQVLGTVTPMVEGYLFCNPEKLTASTFWYNPLIKRNNVVKYNNFPEISVKIQTVADFFYSNSNTIMQYEDFCTRYDTDISVEKYIDIRYTLTNTFQKLKLPQSKLNCAVFPQKPTLIDLATASNKGCRLFYKTLTLKSSLNNKMYLREQKWHTELGTIFSVDFWDGARALCSKIDFDNQLKWLQYQIVRNSLQTNFIVSHFKPNISKQCSYCLDPDSYEVISHLFWFCPYITNFIRNIIIFLNDTGLEFNPTKEQFLFGFLDLKSYAPGNFIGLVLKKYIWRSKFCSANLSVVGFKDLLKDYLYDLKYYFEFKNMHDLFNEWNPLFDEL